MFKRHLSEVSAIMIFEFVLNVTRSVIGFTIITRGSTLGDEINGNVSLPVHSWLLMYHAGPVNVKIQSGKDDEHIKNNLSITSVIVSYSSCKAHS